MEENTTSHPNPANRRRVGVGHAPLSGLSGPLQRGEASVSEGLSRDPRTETWLAKFVAPLYSQPLRSTWPGTCKACVHPCSRCVYNEINAL